MPTCRGSICYRRAVATRRSNARGASMRRSAQQILRKKMERVMGIEPTSSAWEAEVLPLNHTR